MPFTPGPSNPRTADAEYRRNRAILLKDARAKGSPCARCGRPIRYHEPYWLTTPSGRRRVNPRAFVAGHIVDWVLTHDNTLANLQPECARCSSTSGARRGQAQRFPQRERPKGYTNPRW